MADSKSPSHVARIKAIKDSFAFGGGDIKPFFEMDKAKLQRIKIKKATNPSGTFRGHPRGGE